jgi:hypothetical protein
MLTNKLELKRGTYKYPIRKIMDLTNKSSGTVQKIKKLMSENKSK